MNEMSITALFVCLNDFAIHIEQWQRHHLIPGERKRFRQRRVIETLFGRLKEGMRLEHSRRRSATNALLHVVSCLATCILEGKATGMRGLSCTELGLNKSETPMSIAASASVGVPRSPFKKSFKAQFQLHNAKR